MTEQNYVGYLEQLSGELPSLRMIAVRTNKPTEAKPTHFAIIDFEEILGSKPSGPVTRGTDDYALILYTSGTTGQPKGVTLSHRNLVANTKSIVEYLRLTGDDRVMHVLPFTYSYGNSILLTHAAVGGCIVVNRSFLYPNVVLDEMQQHEVTGFSGVPSTYAILLERSTIAERSFPHLRYVTTSGAPMPPTLVNRLRRTLPHVEIFLMYGQTEASTRLTCLPPEKVAMKPGSIGRAISGVGIELLDPSGQPVPVGETGEIVASGPNVMCGYWKRPDLTAKVLRDGKLWTGDLARADEEGCLYIVGRTSDLIKSASHRIAPQEIEEVLLEHRAVAEAAVIGIPDDILGESIHACVVLNEDRICTEEDLIGHCKALLPAFKVPQRFRFYDELPRTESGKIRRAELRALLVDEVN
jgi:acyl-CoA synthetase (AMP-forming)/AMP-acid ligase II